MGNSASQLPYSIDAQVGAPQDHSGWALHEGASTDGNQIPVTVFVGKKPALAKHPISPRFPTRMAFAPAVHHYNHCRKLRHPHILKVLATLDTDNPTAASSGDGNTANNGSGGKASTESTFKATTGDFIIVTEPCVPLEQWLLSNPSSEQIAWGLECVIQGLHFLHASANLAHGNIHPGSFYVTPAGDVKLWNFSLLTQIGPNLGPTNHFKEWEQAVTPEPYRSPERIQQNYDLISQNGGVHGIDSYSLGVLIDHWFQGQIPAVLVKAVQRLQTPNLKMRPRLQPLLKCPIFDTPLQKLQKQFEEITIQPIDQKVQLWQNLGLSLQAGLIPQDLSTFKVLPLIQSSIQATCTNETLVSQDLYRREVLAMINPLFFIVEQYLEPTKVSKTLGPLVSLLFVVKDRGVRGALLGKVSFLSDHLDKQTLNARVFEPLCSGFNDSSPALREMTLKATIGLVPYLNAPNMEKLSRYLVRLQADTETTIRVNAVIFIAKIAPSLSDISRDKMLLPAYARAMKDLFAPCRLAALQSLAKSHELFSKADVAAKVLPVIMPLLLDPMADVRREAFQVVNTLVRILEQESDRLSHLAQREAAERPPAPPATAPAATTKTTATPVKTTQTISPSPSSGSYLSGLSSWMSSSAQPDVPTKTKFTNGVQQPKATNPVAATLAPVPDSTTIQTQSTASLLAKTTITADDDGWGDDDGNDDDWGDEDNDLEEDPFANIGAKTESAASVPTRLAPAPVPSFDDDPFAAIGIKKSNMGVSASTKPKGKLILPSKKGGTSLKVNSKPAPAMKLKIDADEMDDGWDDF